MLTRNNGTEADLTEIHQMHNTEIEAFQETVIIASPGNQSRTHHNQIINVGTTENLVQTPGSVQCLAPVQTKI